MSAEFRTPPFEQTITPEGRSPITYKEGDNSIYNISWETKEGAQVFLIDAVNTYNSMIIPYSGGNVGEEPWKEHVARCEGGRSFRIVHGTPLARMDLAFGRTLPGVLQDPKSYVQEISKLRVKRAIVDGALGKIGWIKKEGRARIYVEANTRRALPEIMRLYSVTENVDMYDSMELMDMIGSLPPFRSHGDKSKHVCEWEDSVRE